jgi:hypothetical protein
MCSLRVWFVERICDYSLNSTKRFLFVRRETYIYTIEDGIILLLNALPINRLYIWIYLSIYPGLYSPCWSWPLFQFLNLNTVGRTPCTGDQPVTRPLPTHRTTQTQNKRTQTSMPRMGFESTIPVFDRAETVHALDRAATVIGTYTNRVT